QAVFRRGISRWTAPLPRTGLPHNCRESKTKRRLELHSRRKFGAVACCEGDGALARCLRIAFSGPPESTTQKGTCMKCASVVKVAAAAAVVIGLVGCQDLKPMQSDIADLKSQVAQLQSQVAASKSSADQAASAAQSASQAASGAQSTAN